MAQQLLAWLRVCVCVLRDMCDHFECKQGRIIESNIQNLSNAGLLELLAWVQLREHTQNHRHTHTHTKTHILTYSHTHLHTHLLTHILTYSHTHLHAHTLTQTHIHTNTHLCLHYTTIITEILGGYGHWYQLSGGSCAERKQRAQARALCQQRYANMLPDAITPLPVRSWAYSTQHAHTDQIPVGTGGYQYLCADARECAHIHTNACAHTCMFTQHTCTHSFNIYAHHTL